jgi:parallel beta helix pectate lyase-like protein
VQYPNVFADCNQLHLQEQLSHLGRWDVQPQ